MQSGVAALLLRGLSIVLIDLLLAGDNALVIAMAVRALQPRQRKIATSLGAVAAVVLRVAITIVATRLLAIDYLKLAGGAMVVWIAVKVLAEAESGPPEKASRNQLMHAVWMIVVADITMSIDNILAVAGASQGNAALIVFGLALSIPFVIFASNLIATIMDRYPAVVYLGSAILGKVGAEMMLTDPAVTRILHVSRTGMWVAEGTGAAAVLAVGEAIRRRRTAK